MRLLQAIFLSLAFHATLMAVLRAIRVPEASQSTSVEVELVSPPSQRNQQIVRNALIDKKFETQTTEEKIRYLADRVQRVQQETKAALSGLSENRDGQEGQKKKPAARRMPSLEELLPNESSPLQARRHQESGGNGFSTVSDSLEVKVGTMTALNTDQYLFYSFFNRVGELVYMRWVPQVQNAQPTVARRLYGRTENTRWTTTIDVWVRPNGEFHSAHILKESGVREFDQAASLAFQQARLFPNPPQELVEDDGFIHLKYNLTVYFDPKVLVQR